MRITTSLLCVSLVVTACIEREGRPIQPCTQLTIRQRVSLDTVDRVDLLLVVDSSGSMEQEQGSLVRELPRMVRILTSGDFDEDGSTDGPDDFEGVRHLNVGVITTDMGTGGHAVPTCSEPAFGDDGVLRTRGVGAGCLASYPPVQSFTRGGAVTPEEFARRVACVAAVGSSGCGFEQPLEAMLKALSPVEPQPWTSAEYVAPGTAGAPRGLEPGFFRSSPPHADGANDGFSRPSSVLAIVVLTDEEDCSAADPALFDPASPTYGGTDPNLRCFVHGDTALHPIERYVEGLVQLRSHPGQIVFAPIVGIPVDLAPGRGESPLWDLFTHPDCGVRDPRLCERLDGSDRLVPSCNVPLRGVAYPPIRVARVARQLEERGAHVTVQSICQESFENALLRVMELVRSSVQAGCMPRPLSLRADGTVDCEVLALLPTGLGCEAHAYAPQLDERGLPVREDGRALCVVPQLVPDDRRPGAADPTGQGWFYDTFTDDVLRGCAAGRAYRIAFAGEQPPSGSELRLECTQPVRATSGDEVSVGTPCDPAADACGAGATLAGTPLACDPVARLCGVRCDSDAACHGAGLAGHVCDRRPLGEADPRYHPGDGRTYGFCVDPKCA